MEKHLSLAEAAERMGISERTARRWIKSGKLRAYKPGRDYWIPESALTELIEESEVHPKASASSQPDFNGLPEEERRPTAAQLDAIEGLKRYSDLLERSVRRQASDDMTATAHQVGMHGYLKVLALLAEDEAVLPALRPVALRFTDLARKYIQLVDDAGEDLERRVVDFEGYFRSRRAS